MRISCIFVSGFLAMPLSGCDRFVKFDPSRTDALEARVGSQEGVLKAMQAELGTLKAQLLVAQYRMDSFEQQSTRAQSDKARSEPSILSPEQVASLSPIIADCVKLVRASGQQGGTMAEMEAKFWTGFDAYYNPASGRVENNVMYNGQRPALYAFNKCMSAKGVPVS